ncbi:MAG: hypothetical protein Q9N02_08660 [Ghiorsea sp.]|nr:hypothetical protein [Ghiorsea sp.]
MGTFRASKIEKNNDVFIKSICVLVKAFLWLCLALTPWALFAGLADITGVIELSSLTFKATVFTLIGGAIQAALCTQK